MNYNNKTSKISNSTTHIFIIKINTYKEIRQYYKIKNSCYALLIRYAIANKKQNRMLENMNMTRCNH